MSTNEDKKNQSLRNLAGFSIFLMLSQPALFIPLAIFGGIVYLVAKAVIKSQQGGAVPKQPRQEKFDDCPQKLFCFHKDKGEHHVRRGKEIDPWDRPDIDIRKYQRRE